MIFKKFNYKKWLLILLGSLSWSLTIIKSGWVYKYGMGFWGANGHDGIWHLALAERLAKNSFDMPVFSGHALQNYHLGFDLIMALVNKITGLPLSLLYFQIIPPILAVAIGILSYNFAFRWFKSDKASLWSLFFVYFGGSLGFLIGSGESAFWSQQAISSLINPPFALSLGIMLSGLIFLQKLDDKKNFVNILVASVLFGLLIEVKVYAGLLALGGLFVSGVFRALKNKKYDFLFVFFVALAIAFAIYFPFNKNSQGLIVFQPFWFLETMMGLSDRVGWPKFYSAMTTYKSGHMWLKLVPAYLVAFVIFWVGNMGTRIIKELAILRSLKNIKNLTWVHVFAYSVIFAGGIIPMFFLQKGTPWNTIQFFYYSLFFSSFLAGSYLPEIKDKLIIVVVVLLTIPTTIGTLKNVYLPGRPPAMLSNEELTALTYLKNQPDGVILTYLFDEIASKKAESNPPRPLYLYTSTAYVSAFTGKETFFEDETNLDITGYDLASRKNEIKSWYKERDQSKAREFLKTNNIKYIYWIKGQRALLGEGQLGLQNIFENTQVTIYQVE